MSFSDKLLSWFDLHGRKDLPWQINKTPYRVWVSEIMLQQTQVTTVIDYYLRFMDSFPSVEALANAPEDQVLEHWSGLGYYARARNLHKTARIVAQEHQGEFPNTVEGLSELPGIGRSTAGAIVSIAFQKFAPILDGNVKRVLCRVYGIDTWSGERETEKKLWQIATENTPESRVFDYSQAIMDLGATLCTRSKPNCANCPMLDDCEAFKHNLQSKLPVSKPKKKIPTKQTQVLLIESEAGILLEKRPSTGIWGGLYSLPEIEADAKLEELLNKASQLSTADCEFKEKHASFQHTFSHFKLDIIPVLIKASVINAKIGKATHNKVAEQSSLHWIKPEALDSIGLPAPISKYLARIYSSDLLSEIS